MAQGSYDVIVVGGGPAGSTCAWMLRRAGLHVLVKDRQRFPRDKTCAGWITPQVLDTLELDAAAYAATGKTIQPLLGFQVAREGCGSARIQYPDIVSYGIRRCEFDAFLLRRSGAELELGAPMLRLERRGDAWVIDDRVRAPILIGAGGHFCPVARHLGVRIGQDEPIVAAQEIEFPLRDADADGLKTDPFIPEISFTADLRGYGWVFRKGHYLNVGLGRQDREHLSEHVSDFLRRLVHDGKIPACLPGAPKGHPYLLYGTAPRPLGAPAVLLIGDAAGLAYPRSGEGIRPAVESGILAAESILETAAAKDERLLQRYTARIEAQFGPRTAPASPLDALPEGVTQWLAGRLMRNHWFARHVVLDDWFFHRRQEPLHVSHLGGSTMANDAETPPVTASRWA